MSKKRDPYSLASFARKPKTLLGTYWIRNGSGNQVLMVIGVSKKFVSLQPQSAILRDDTIRVPMRDFLAGPAVNRLSFLAGAKQLDWACVGRYFVTRNSDDVRERAWRIETVHPRFLSVKHVKTGAGWSMPWTAVATARQLSDDEQTLLLAWHAELTKREELEALLVTRNEELERALRPKGPAPMPVEETLTSWEHMEADDTE
jgi:hypothetical protein